MTVAESPEVTERGPEVEIIPARCRDLALGTAALGALVVPTLVMAVVVLDEWITRPEQRGWLVLGFGFYIITALKGLLALLRSLCERVLYLRVEVRRFVAGTLFEALTEVLAQEAEKQGLTCSWDQEALQEHDKLTGKIKVKLRFWSSRARTMRVQLRLPPQTGPASGSTAEGMLDVQVEFHPGEDVVCGRDSRVERREVLVLNVASAPDRALEDKQRLARWMDYAYAQHVKPIQDVVNVFSLQESSSDWVPEWKFERVKPCKSALSTGTSFYLESEDLSRLLRDAKVWHTKHLRVYMITGPPGVGKSESTIWLAGRLGLPVYRLSLCSVRLSDSILAQLFSQSSITFSPILVQVDEFQQSLRTWRKNQGTGHGGGVTAGGFCELLQGSMAMSQGVVVLTGTPELLADFEDPQMSPVFRRIDDRAQLGWMTREGLGQYFRHFLCGFLPSCTEEVWDRWTKEFLSVSSWSGHISIDMLKRYMMHQITNCTSAGFGKFVKGSEVGSEEVFKVNEEHLTQVFTLMCSSQHAEKFLAKYAPVAGHSAVLLEPSGVADCAQGS